MNSISHRPTPECVLEQLGKICRGRSFSQATRLKSFLVFVVTQALEDREEKLNEYTIGVEVFAKSSAFDPRNDSTVRTTAGRIRARLREYYATEGQGDPILIEFPEGAYVPRFLQRFRSDPSQQTLVPSPAASVETELDPRESAGARGPFLLNRNLKRSIGVALVVGLAVVALVVGLNANSDFWRRRTPEILSTELRVRPSVAVIGFRPLAASTDTDLPEALSSMFRTELAANGKLRVIPAEDVARMNIEISPAEADSLSRNTLSAIRKNLGADFIVLGSCFGSLRRSDEHKELRLDVKAQDTRTGETVAAIPDSGSAAVLFSMVSNTGMLLREKMGAGGVSALNVDRVKRSFPASDEARHLYSAAVSKLRTFQFLEARELLDRAAAIDGKNALVQSALAEAWSHLGSESNASQAARRAFELSRGAPPEEARLIEGRYDELSKNWGKAIDIYQSLWNVFRDNVDYGLRLANAQTSAKKTKEAFQTIEEMRRLPPPLRDDPRIDLAEALAAELAGDFHREVRAAEKAAAIAEQAGARLLVASANLRACWALNQLGERQKAREYAEQARRTFVAVGDRSGEASALKNLADVLDDLGDHGEAKKFYEIALNLFRQLGQEDGVAVTLINLGYAQKDLGDLAGAQRAFEDSFAISSKLGNERRQAQALNSLGVILSRRGNIEEAAKRYNQAVQHFRESGDRSDAATVLGNIAILLQNEGRLDEAQKKLEESLQDIRQIGDRPGEARTLGNLGTLLILRGNLTEARRQFDQHLAIAHEMGDSKQQAYALQGLGDILIAQGELEAAKAKLQEALSLRTRTGEEGLAAETRLSLAEAFFEQEDLTSAESNARAAAEEFLREDEFGDAGTAEALIARTFLAQGKSLEAQQTIKLAKEHAAKSEDRSVHLGIAIQEARIRAKAGKMNEALKDLKSTLKKAVKYGSVPDQFETRLAIAEIEMQTGSPSGVAHLKELEGQAGAKGFRLMQRKAAQHQVLIPPLAPRSR